MWCKKCGYGPEAGVHLPPAGAAKDAPPWGHKYEAADLTKPERDEIRQQNCNER